MPPVRRRMLPGLALALGAWPRRSARAQARASAAELRIGAIYPSSGPFALLGDESFRGLELAVEARNRLGGVQGRPLRLVRAEAADAAQAGEAVRRLSAAGPERVAAIFGTGASVLSAAATQAAELQGMPYFELGATADSITGRGFRHVFRTCPHAGDLALLSLRAVSQLVPALWPGEGGEPRIAVLHEDGLCGRAVGGLQEAGLRGAPGLLGRFPYVPGGQDLPAMVQRLRAGHARFLLHTGPAGEVLTLFRAMREAQWRPAMVIGAGAGYSLADTAQAMGRAFEGVMSADVPPYAAAGPAGEAARELAEAYTGTYGHPPRSGHSLANCAGATLCLEALHQAGSLEAGRIRAAVLALDISAAEGPFGWGAAFDEAGQNRRAPLVLSQWQHGRLLPVFPAEAAAAAPRPELG